MLSPVFAQYMVTMVGATLVKKNLLRITEDDHQKLFLVALYLGQDAQANELVLDMLQDYGEYIMEQWTTYSRAVHAMNSNGSKSAKLDVNQFLAGLDPGT
jgi:hypothetical protein